MNPRIGPACAEQFGFGSRKLSDGIFHYFLHRKSAVLALPAGVFGSVVCDCQADSFHSHLLKMITDAR